ncbi:MarR family winged helix-turn-helix transcriptional regulator [Hoyosella subflava]|uniref:MarR-family protein transcriptional regulator n=1 Tax=Hoyosella subflava (strain DSM 45089 / JCM 17490 / NBRC 109087 / DQS3-9A1) TaxID=443218 RepID=F6EMS7_HOYSD|nr:MarR family winged helix-turn-helix transcriptional regulator [Hoyosella subflava]AEF42819.1 MarR-family protein transcriptional regulator [Hoyosella subflava DQS3-9A1]
MATTTVDLTFLDEQVLRLFRALRRPGFRSRVLEGVPEIPGVGDLRVLRSVERHEARGESPSIGVVASELEVEQSTASRAVNAVIARGLLTKTSCPDDQRRTRLRLTAKGVTALNKATENRAALLAEITDAWSDDERRTLSALLSRLADGYDQIEATYGAR